MLTPTHLETLRALAVPGDLWGDVLAEYEGPARALRGGRVLDGVYAGRDEDGIDMVWTPARGIVYPEALTLPLTHPLARAHVAHLMAAGLRCPCETGYRDARHSDEVCEQCSGTGYLRPPRPAWHLLPADECNGGLPPELAEHAPALMACHVARVACGLGGVRGVLGTWRWIRHSRIWSRTTAGCSLVASESGWATSDNAGASDVMFRNGPETGPTGMAAADAAALTAGFALVTPDGGLALPWPDLSAGGPDDR